MYIALLVCCKTYIFIHPRIPSGDSAHYIDPWDNWVSEDDIYTFYLLNIYK